MIITDKFVMINFPKTGSTFVRNVLKKIHQKENESALDQILYKFRIKKQPFYQNLWLPNIRTTQPDRKDTPDEHGLYSQIPEEHKSKTIVSVKRNIFERLVSLYEYRDWAVAPYMPPSQIHSFFPEFPNLSFSRFLEMLYKYPPLEQLLELKEPMSIGPMSAQFIHFYSKQPIDDLRLTLSKEQAVNCLNNIANIVFLDQNNLSEELFEFLLKMGYNKKEIRFIVSAPKLNQSVKKPYAAYFSDEEKNFVMQKEWLLFQYFNDWYV